MTRFTDADRERIREALRETGREQFTRFGLERTRIKDLTEAVGIGTSTFYQFFDSKEALYLAILAREGERVQAELSAELESVDDVRLEVRRTIEHFLEELSSNPLYYRLLIEDEIRQLHDAIPDDVLAEHHREAMTTGDDRIERWVAHDGFRVDEPEELQAMFRLLGFTIAARSELFEPAGATDLYEAGQALLIDAVVDGLFVDED